MGDPRLDKLARVLVRYSVAVKRDQLVRIHGAPVSLPLIETLFREVIEVGGHPYVEIGSESTNEIFLKRANDDQLKYVSPIRKYAVEQIDASIGIWADENTKALSNVDPNRQAIASAARRPVMETFLKRAAQGELRWTGTQYPTQASAQDAEMSLGEYEDFVFNAGLLQENDPISAWKEISQRQARFVDFLNQKQDIRIQAPNGTDLSFSVAGRTWINCDGHENFPDGEVFSAPVEDSVNGTIEYSFPAVHNGREVHDIRLTFEDGQVVDASASKNQDYLIGMLDQDPGARILGECAVGTNYSITQYTRNTLFDEKIGGTCHLALGATYPETGGKNSSGLHWDMVCDLRKGGTIAADGEVFHKDGQWQV